MCIHNTGKYVTVIFNSLKHNICDLINKIYKKNEIVHMPKPKLKSKFYKRFLFCANLF